MRFGCAGADSMFENIRAARRGLRRRGEAAHHVGNLCAQRYYDAYYLKAQQVRTLIKRDFEQAFAQVDDCGATSPTTAFRIGEKVDDPIQMYLTDIFTISANLAGVCAVSVPCGFDKANLPIGMQLIGPHLGEETILRAADAYERATDWQRHAPALTGRAS